jgi:hypothetical protein
VGHPEEVGGARERGDDAVDEGLQMRPREGRAGAQHVARVAEQLLELVEERLRALRGRLRRGRLGGDGLAARRRRLRERGGHGHAAGGGDHGPLGRTLGGRPLRGGRLADDAAHEVAHAHHQATPTMSLMTSAMIFSPISFARLV